MIYRLKPGQPISGGIKRIAAAQIKLVRAQLTGKASQGTAVHEARKAIKRLRALLTLIRPAIGKAAHAAMQERMRTIARSLSGLRDVQAMLDTIARLEAYNPEVGGGPVAAALRRHLEARGREAGEHLDRTAPSAARKMAAEAKESFARLTLDDNFDPVAHGLEDNYRKACRAFARAYDRDTGVAFHEWRKLVQRHWRHLQLIAGAAPKRIRPLIRLARDLSATLGNDHDLEVLRDLVKAEGAGLGNRAEVKAYLALCRERQRGLRAEARRCGRRLFAKPAGVFAAQFREHWERAETRARQDQSGD